MFSRAAMCLAAILASLAVTASALATPHTVIVLRHGEKQNPYALCQTGMDRANALAVQYLGKGAANSLFAGSDGPAAFLAITLHTLELITPAAASWGLPVTMFSVMPDKKARFDGALDLRTQQAARAVMTDPQWSGKTVVMAWEHRHIADKKLEAKSPGERSTLRQLLNLDKLAGVPETWPGGNYDYFWIVQYGAPGSDVPTEFKSVKQVFAPPFEKLPSNDWGSVERLPLSARCLR
ncbi:MAG: histidine phosphatase family protein [Pseudorhodoplanes sp.]|nr:histidine phosphatase family protein [Pseudorhodoplanes sp.]